jgi:hypothetical protein
MGDDLLEPGHHDPDAAARVQKMFHDQEADNAVQILTLEEQQRRQWCVQVTLSAYSLETTRENFLTIADKIYDYVYGTRIK